MAERFAGARLGDLWSEAVVFYYDNEKLATLAPNDSWYPPSIFFQGVKFMLFGDPTLRLAVFARPRAADALEAR